MSDTLLLQTLVVGEGDYREFYGHIEGIGWCTSTTPIKMFDPNVSMTDFIKLYEHDFTDVRLVNIKIEITEKI